MKHAGIERRAYFRINDVIGLSYSVIEGGRGTTARQRSGTQIQLLGLLSKIDNDINEYQRAVAGKRQRRPAIGLLNRKIS